MDDAESDFDYDLRQIVLMQAQLAHFGGGAMHISDLIHRMESLLHCLRTGSKEWREEFLAEWATLEIVCAVALNRQQAFDSEDLRRIMEAVGNLRILVFREKKRLEGLVEE